MIAGVAALVVVLVGLAWWAGRSGVAPSSTTIGAEHAGGGARDGRDEPSSGETPGVEAPNGGAATDEPPRVDEPTTIGVVAPPPTAEPLTRHIESEPSGAEVVRDGAVIGTTPFELELSEGETIRIELRRRGYRTVTETVSEESLETITTRLPRRDTSGGFPELAPR